MRKSKGLLATAGSGGPSSGIITVWLVGGGGQGGTGTSSFGGGGGAGGEYQLFENINAKSGDLWTITVGFQRSATTIIGPDINLIANGGGNGGGSFGPASDGGGGGGGNSVPGSMREFFGDGGMSDRRSANAGGGGGATDAGFIGGEGVINTLADGNPRVYGSGGGGGGATSYAGGTNAGTGGSTTAATAGIDGFGGGGGGGGITSGKRNGGGGAYGTAVIRIPSSFPRPTPRNNLEENIYTEDGVEYRTFVWAGGSNTKDIRWA